MKRDWEVIRGLLIKIEQAQEGDGYTFELPIVKQEEKIQQYHIELLLDAEFISGIPAFSFSHWELLNVKLTWKGHDLLAHIQSSSIWEKIKEKAVDKGFDLSFHAVMKIANTLIDAIS